VADKEHGQEGEEEEEKRELDPTEGMSDLGKEMHFVLSQRKQEVVARLIPVSPLKTKTQRNA